MRLQYLRKRAQFPVLSLLRAVYRGRRLPPFSDTALPRRPRTARPPRRNRSEAEVLAENLAMLSDRKLRWVGDDEAFPWAGKLPRGPIQPYFGCGGESAITSPGPGVVKWLIALSSPSLLPSLPIEVTL